MKCDICKSKDFKEYSVREMMFGSGEKFKYMRCKKCNFIFIKKIPIDMNYYYPDNYVAYNNCGRVSNFFRKVRDEWVFSERGLLGFWVNLFFPSYVLKHFKDLNIKKDSRILEVGCGRGDLIKFLNKFGFKNVLGVDRFVPSFLTNTLIKKGDLDTVKGEQFDLIIFNHVIEHMTGIPVVFNKIKALLSPGGLLYYKNSCI
ncbi:MAG: class I SAM-dependent methyltransferase [Sphaerochaetaceae bacterium]|nr:class I SAM-dependent methyltransferase [Sphaerochaetaceae bacterium]